MVPVAVDVLDVESDVLKGRAAEAAQMHTGDKVLEVGGTKVKGWGEMASAISKHSARPYETVKPLAKALSAPLDATYADQDYGALAQELFAKHRYDGSSVLICWHHGTIPKLAQGFTPGNMSSNRKIRSGLNLYATAVKSRNPAAAGSSK